MDEKTTNDSTRERGPSDDATATGFTAEYKVHTKWKKGKKRLAIGESPKPPPVKPRPPKITQLLALAIHWHNLIEKGEIRDYAQIARRTGLTRARVTQIMNLTLLAPRIQEDILFLPKIRQGSDPISERNIRDIALEPRWDKQLKQWEDILGN